MTNLQQLQDLAETQFTIEQEIVTLTEDLRAAKKALLEISEKALPEAMDDLDIEAFTTKSGLRISVARALSVGKLTNQRALRWLDENGHAGMIKSDVVVPFSRGDSTDAEALCEQLEAEGMNPKMAEHVHASTIKSFLAAQLRDGEAVDLELFGAYERPVAKIELPK